MISRGWGVAAALMLALSGCSAADQTSSAALPTPALEIPSDLMELIDATATGDVDVVRNHIMAWNEEDVRYLTGDEISPACAQQETSRVGSYARNEELEPRLRNDESTGGLILWFEAVDSSATGWGVENIDGVWYFQPQTDACQVLWYITPSPSAG